MQRLEARAAFERAAAAEVERSTITRAEAVEAAAATAAAEAAARAEAEEARRAVEREEVRDLSVRSKHAMRGSAFTLAFNLLWCVVFVEPPKHGGLAGGAPGTRG